MLASRFVKEADRPLEFAYVFRRLNNNDVRAKSCKQYETIILDMRVPTGFCKYIYKTLHQQTVT